MKKLLVVLALLVGACSKGGDSLVGPSPVLEQETVTAEVPTAVSADAYDPYIRQHHFRVTLEGRKITAWLRNPYDHQLKAGQEGRIFMSVFNRGSNPQGFLTPPPGSVNGPQTLPAKDTIEFHQEIPYGTCRLEVEVYFGDHLRTTNGGPGGYNIGFGYIDIPGSDCYKPKPTPKPSPSPSPSPDPECEGECSECVGEPIITVVETEGEAGACELNLTASTFTPRTCSTSRVITVTTTTTDPCTKQQTVEVTTRVETEACECPPPPPPAGACYYTLPQTPAFAREFICESIGSNVNANWNGQENHCKTDLPGISFFGWNLVPGQSAQGCLKKPHGPN